MRSWADDEATPGHELDIPAIVIMTLSIVVLFVSAATSLALRNSAFNSGYAAAAARYSVELERVITSEQARCHAIMMDALRAREPAAR